MENKTIAELIVLCRQRGIKGYTGLVKGDIIKLLEGRYVPRESKAVSSRVRNALWRLYFNTLDGNCYVCSALISFDNFEAGHVVARKNGGASALHNLKPICGACNRSMGTMNLEDFKLTLEQSECIYCRNGGFLPGFGARFCTCKLGRDLEARAPPYFNKYKSGSGRSSHYPWLSK